MATIDGLDGDTVWAAAPTIAWSPLHLARGRLGEAFGRGRGRSIPHRAVGPSGPVPTGWAGAGLDCAGPGRFQRSCRPPRTPLAPTFTPRATRLPSKIS